MNGEQKLLGLLAGYAALASAILASFSVRGSDSHVLVGLLLGSTFAYAILASSWTVLGPGTKKQRLPMAAILLIVFPTVFLFSGDGDILFLIVLSQILIAAMVQLLVWMLRAELWSHFWPNCDGRDLGLFFEVLAELI